MSIRVALVSVGLGRIQRGYERYFTGIFEAVRNRLDVTLYKSGGAQTERERIPAMLGPAMATLQYLPLGLVAGGAEYRAYKNDCLAFALTLLPDLLRGRFDVIHVIDYPLAIALVRIRRLLRFPTRVLFTDGGLMPPQYYPKADHIHITAQQQYEVSRAWGHPATYLSMVPCGFDAGQFARARNRREIRDKHGITENTVVILAVSAVKKIHKRVDHILTEAARIQGDFLLWIDGKPEDTELVEIAREKLGERCRITHVPTDQIPELYHAADIFVHAALEEGFGLALCEAGAAGLIVIGHDSPHFRWLLGPDCCLVDMNVPGELSKRLQILINMPAASRDRQRNNAASVRERFDWNVVASQYSGLYEKVARA